MIRLLFLFCCFFVPQELSAQTPDSLHSSHILPEYTISETRFTSTGYSFWKADSLPVSSPIALSDRLLWENTLEVRANAPGTLATLSVRGAGATRTPVFWNGINLQSPMNGVIDASLLTFWPDDQLEVRYGGQSAAQSSGAMGGSVTLSQGEQTLGTGFSGFVQGAAGSFGQYDGSGRLGYANKKIASQIRAVWQQADNDFWFKKQGLDGQFYPTRQVNNFVHKTDLQQFNLLQINARNTLKTSLWVQNVFRELPPATTEAPRTTWQRDRANRALASWEHASDSRVLWITRAAWINDFLSFHLSGDTDTSRSKQVLLSTERSSTLGKQWAWRAGGTALRQWAQVDGYQDSITWFGQTRLAAHGMGEWRKGDRRFSALFRKEWAEAQAAPFTWSLGGQVGLGRVGQTRFHFSRNFNLPTLNDRYWKLLGRPELRPEKGYSADLATTLNAQAFSLEIRAFQMILDDWILWQPDSTGLFRPGNLRKVWSRGLESGFKWQLSKPDWKVHLSGNLQVSKTTNLEVYDGSESALGKQLPYTSRVSGGLALRVSRGFLSAAYLQQFTGTRYDNSGNTVRAFQVGNLLCSAALWKRRITLDVRLENLWNVQYEIIRYRPMPGRSWHLGVGYKW
jgi:vitamin B12 transporter